MDKVLSKNVNNLKYLEKIYYAANFNDDEYVKISLWKLIDLRKYFAKILLSGRKSIKTREELDQIERMFEYYNDQIKKLLGL